MNKMYKKKTILLQNTKELKANIQAQGPESVLPPRKEKQYFHLNIEFFN